MRLRSAAGLLYAVLSAGCSVAEASLEPTAYETNAVVSEGIETIAMVFPALPNRCSGDDIALRETLVLVTSTELCLSCKDTGWLARRLLGLTDKPLAVLTHPDDAEFVCAYLERERVPPAVITLSAEGAVWWPPPHLVLGELDAEGVVVRSQAGQFGWELLAHWIGEEERNPTRHRPPSP